MAFNGSNNQKALVRDQHGHLKGFAGGPGRPLGSRNKLTEDFLGDMHAASLEHGPNVINRLIADQPEVFLQAILKIAQVHRVEVGRPEAFDRPRTREEALQRLEESAGPEARKLLEGFLKKVDKLERDQDLNGLSANQAIQIGWLRLVQWGRITLSATPQRWPRYG